MVARSSWLVVQGVVRLRLRQRRRSHRRQRHLAKMFRGLRPRRHEQRTREFGATFPRVPTSMVMLKRAMRRGMARRFTDAALRTAKSTT